MTSRVVRDKLTKVGKGSGLLQFADAQGLEEALKLDGQTWNNNVIHVQKSKYPVKY